MICITGANGFVGKALTSKLLKSGYSIKTHSKASQPVFSTEHYHFSLCEPVPQEFIANCETLVHLACSLDKRRSFNLSQDIETEVKGASNLFEQFIKSNPSGRIVFLSTGGAIYDSSKEHPHKESDPTSLDTSYALTKYLSENILTYLCKKHGFKAVSLRVSNPYGEVFSGRTQGIIGLAVSKLSTNETLNVFENLETTRDYIYISDVLDAITSSMWSNSIQAGTNEIINIGSGIQTSIVQMIHLINSLSGKSLKYELSNQNSAPTFNCLDIEKARTFLSWAPQVSLQEGLSIMLAKNSAL